VSVDFAVTVITQPPAGDYEDGLLPFRIRQRIGRPGMAVSTGETE
jgi:hypothetical protein